MCSPEVGTANLDVEVARNVSSRNPSVRFNGCKFGHRASLVTTKCSGNAGGAVGVVVVVDDDDGCAFAFAFAFATDCAWHAFAAIKGLAEFIASCV